MQLQNFRITFEQVQPLTKFISSKCNEIMFVNLSTVNTVTVSNFPIKPGAFLSINGNVGEMDVTTYRVIQAAPGDCWVVRKFYVKK